MKKPLFNFDEKVQCNITGRTKFTVTVIEKRGKDFYYQHPDTLTWWNENCLKTHRASIEPISSTEFNMIWRAHYRCLWDNGKSHDLYVNLKNFLELKGFIYE